MVDELSRGQAHDWWTHGHTHTYTHTQATTVPEGQNWPKVKNLNRSWWRLQMETFSMLLALCVGNSPVISEIPIQRPATQGFDIFFDLHLNKQLSKQPWDWRFEMPLRPLWRHCNACQIGLHGTIMQWWHHKPLVTWWFVQQLVEANNKETSKFHYWPSVSGIH